MYFDRPAGILLTRTLLSAAILLTASSSTASYAGSIAPQVASPGKGSVVISGSEKNVTVCQGHGNPPVCHTTYDMGTVSVTVDGYNVSTPYGTGSQPNAITAQTIATSLAASLNVSGSPVTATVTQNNTTTSTLNITAKATGAGSDYPLSASVTNDTIQRSQRRLFQRRRPDRR